MVKNDIKIDDETIRIIEGLLSRDDRVELIPTRHGVKIMRIKRHEVTALSPETQLKKSSL